MCGIAGIRRFDGQPVDPELLQSMSATLTHRGPDGAGVWCSGPVGLANRRLAIIDPRGSPQPMSAPGGICHVTFNGEIFNYRRLRRELTYPFATSGDTELLLALFLRDGWKGVRRLEGQFAYALFDQRDETLWLFRDRMGVLPLYYYHDADLFLFASEIKAILAALPESPTVDESCLADYLAHRVVPAPRTLFKGIQKLPQAHGLRVTSTGQIDVIPYWSLPREATMQPVTDAQAIDLVSGVLCEAVDRALVADVPVGAYLSGGVDSSLIVALMTRQAAGPIHTFSAGFGDPRVDEVSFARRASELLGTAHHEVPVRADDFASLWQRLTWHRDAPLSEPADIAVFRLATVAREHVKVVLSGEGSDELFAGYPKYRFGPLAFSARMLPSQARTVLDRGQQLLPARAHRLRIALRAMTASSDGEWLRGWFAPFTERERVELLGAAPHAIQSGPFGWSTSRDVLRRMLYFDSQSWLADNLLERGDRMSMAASVELRPPFLDHHLVELAFALPSSVKVRRGQTKWVIKEIAGRYLPPELVGRRKVGFRVPLDAWFRGTLQAMASDLLLSPGSFVGRVMEPKPIRDLLDNHSRRRSNEEIRIWTLLALEVWHTVFFKDPLGRRQSVPRAPAAIGRRSSPPG
jgi:asparagine synthase (glutamine-hydrolysing)